MRLDHIEDSRVVGGHYNLRGAAARCAFGDADHHRFAADVG